MTICADCPDLDNDAERPPPPWKPRARCCRDEHMDRRLAGDDRPWEGVETARAISDREEAAGIKPGTGGRNRSARRKATATATARKAAK